jgi:tetratricopeptide (TPR) repeat protein
VLADTLVTLAFAQVAVDGSISPGSPEGEAATAALALAEGRGDWYHASIIEAAFAIAESTVDPAATEAWLDRATEAARRTGNPFVLGNIVGVRGRVASRAGRLAEAERWFVEARAYYRAMGNGMFERVLSSELAHALRRDGRLEEAELEYRQTIRGWQESGNRGAVANQLECFGFIALARGDGTRAARLLGAAEAIREAAGAPMTAFEREEYDTAVERSRARLDASAVESAWTAGRLMTVDAAVAFALSPPSQGGAP